MDTVPGTPMMSTSYNPYLNSTIKPQNTSYFYPERDENVENKLKNLQIECQRLTEIVSYCKNGIEIEELLKTIASLKNENRSLEKKASSIYLHYISLKNEKQKNFSLNEKEVSNLKSEKLQLEIENADLKASLSDTLDQLTREKNNTEYLKNQLNLQETNYNSRFIEYEKKMEDLFLASVNNEEKNEQMNALHKRISILEEEDRENRKLIEELQASCAKFLKERHEIIDKVNKERASLLQEVSEFKARLEVDLTMRNEKITDKNKTISDLKKDVARLKAQLAEATAIKPQVRNAPVAPNQAQPLSSADIAHTFNAVRENITNILTNSAPPSNIYLKAKSEPFIHEKEKENQSNGNSYPNSQYNRQFL